MFVGNIFNEQKATTSIKMEFYYLMINNLAIPFDYLPSN